MLNGKHMSFWLDDDEAQKFEKLDKEIEVDVVIVGGGIAGISTGFLLKKAGFKIAIIEESRFSHDVTGSATAKVTEHPNLIYSHILSNYGIETALNFKNAYKKAFNKIAEIIKEYNIDCDYKKIPWYIYSSDETNSNKIQEEYDAGKKLGIDVSLTNVLPSPFENDLTDENNDNKNNKAIVYKNQAEFHPKKYSNGLIKEIDGNGSFIFEKTKVLNIENKEKKKIITNNGIISADYVVIATNSPIYDPDSVLSYMFQPKSYVNGVYVEEKLPDGMFVNIDPFHTYRTTPTEKGDLLIVAGEHHLTGQKEDTWDSYKKLRKHIDDKFEVKSFEYYWSNQDNKTDDMIPAIGETSQKGIYLATGFGSWGMTTGMVAGIIISDSILNKENDFAYVFNPQRFKNRKSKKKRCLSNFNVEDLNEKESDEVSDFVFKMKNNSAKILNLEKHSLAIYKDEDSNIYILSGNCTHFGCGLKWNTAEKTWECPQHGSRFNYNGKNIHSPAIKDLKSYINNEDKIKLN